jgi:glucose/arabinose dehydrogenase
MRMVSLLAAVVLAGLVLPRSGHGEDAEPGRRLTGKAAFGDWRSDAPGTWRRITVDDLPPPGATSSATNGARVVTRPEGATPKAPEGFRVDLFATLPDGPRTLLTAPNGDIFVAETLAGRVSVLRAADGAVQASETAVFASGLNGPFGLAFYPPGPDPQWLYVANTGAVIRFPYRRGNLKAEGRPQTIVPDLPHRGGHSTRNIAFSRDGTKMFVSVGSLSNVAEGVGTRDPSFIERWQSEHGLGALWGVETERAVVLVFDPEGKGRRIFATGIRNCVGLAVHPATGDLWCSTNERDGLGDDLVPDYVTRVREGAFYGWPWYYLGANPDPRRAGERPDLKDKVTIPDVLLQAHSASLGLAFYDAGQFPAEYRGDGFAAEHGSWNRARRTGYKVVRVKLKDGVPTGDYQDFLTGFVVSDSSVWGRPVGLAVARDGALLVAEDGNGTIWRVAWEKK